MGRIIVAHVDMGADTLVLLVELCATLELEEGLKGTQEFYIADGIIVQTRRTL